MSKLPLQRGTSQISDFDENTWTFEMPETFRVTAGRFVIIPEDKFEIFEKGLYGLRESITGIDNQKVIEEVLLVFRDIHLGE